MKINRNFTTVKKWASKLLEQYDGSKLNLNISYIISLQELCVKSAVDEYWKEEKVEMMQQKIPENIHFNGSYVRKVMYEKWETLEPERGKKFEMLQQISPENMKSTRARALLRDTLNLSRFDG